MNAAYKYTYAHTHSQENLGDMVEETDSLSLTRMMELADSDIWYADDIDNVEDAKLASEMLYVLKTASPQGRGF